MKRKGVFLVSICDSLNVHYSIAYFLSGFEKRLYLNRLRNSFISYTTTVIKPLNEVITTKDCQYFTSVMEPYNTQFKDLPCECIELNL